MIGHKENNREKLADKMYRSRSVLPIPVGFFFIIYESVEVSRLNVFFFLLLCFNFEFSFYDFTILFDYDNTMGEYRCVIE